MGKLINLLSWHKRKNFSKELKDILLALPRVVDWNDCVNKDGKYEIVFTKYDVGLLSPNGTHIYIVDIVHIIHYANMVMY